MPPVVRDAGVSIVEPDGEPGSSKDTPVDHILANTKDALSVATNFGSLMPLPVVQPLISAAQNIVTIAQLVRKNKKDCAELANKVRKVVETINKNTQGHESAMSAQTMNAISALNLDLHEIEATMKELVAMSSFKGFLKRASISDKFATYNAKLDFAMQIFQTTSAVRVETQVTQVLKVVTGQSNELATVKGIIQSERQYHEEDGQYYLYRKGNVQVIREIRARHVKKWHNAIVKGERKAVKIFEGSDSAYWMERELDRLKAVSMRPNLIQLSGYSDFGSPDRFYVVHGDFVPFDDYLPMLPKADQGLFYLTSCRAAIAAQLQLLESQKLTAHFWPGQLMVDRATHEITLGVGGFAKFDEDDDSPIQTNLLTEDPSYDDFDDAKQKEGNLSKLYNLLSRSQTSGVTHEEALQLFWSFAKTSLEALKFHGCPPSVTLLPVGSYVAPSRLPPLSEDVTNPWNVKCIDLAHCISQYISWPPKIGFAKFPDGMKIRPLNQTRVVRLKKANLQLIGDIEFGCACNCFWDEDRPEYPCIVQHNIALAKARGVGLGDICHVMDIEVDMRASILSKPFGDQPIFFHILPLMDGAIPLPWGYFSLHPSPILDEREIPLKAKEVEDDAYYSLKFAWASTVEGVDAQVTIACRTAVERLSSWQVGALQTISQLFNTDHAGATGTITESGDALEETEESDLRSLLD